VITRINGNIIKLIIGAGLFCFAHHKVDAQKHGLFSTVEVDTNYIHAFNKTLTGRTFLSQKYTSVSIGGSSRYPDFRYKPNTSLNLGVGLTYKMFSLNLAYGAPGLNGNNSQRGKTRYLDLQSHIYSRKFVVDLFGQFYKGFYISPKNYVPGTTGYYQNPDLKINLLGFAVYYLFNSSRFSYQAALIQNEWQTTSSGTFLVGINLNYGITADGQSIVPTAIQHEFPQGQVQELRFLNFGSGVGYAYNFVYKKHWFATGSLTATLTANFSKESEKSLSKTHTSIAPNFLYRIGIGYNSEKWEAVASLVNNTVTSFGAFSNSPYTFRMGNVRLTLAHRFSLQSKFGKEINKKLQSIESIP
jgi:hypothetical protein